MPDKPVVFISATSDLRSARDLVGKVLYAMGYEPVWQEIAATAGGELLAVLRARLEPAALLVQLVGPRYGAEPPSPTAEFGRISYTQFEALEAERLGKPVIYHFLDDGFPRDAADPEPPELVALQAVYRERLIAANRLRYDRIATTTDLELVDPFCISDELQKLRGQADRRHRRLLRLVAATAVGIVLIVGLILYSAVHRLSESDARLDDKLLALREQVAAALAPKAPPVGQNQPEPLPPEIVAKAKILLAQGTAEDQALAKIALNQHAEADQIIQDLKSKPGNPIDEAFRLLSMEGNNWYQADEPDKAIGPFEQAMALKPNDITARNSLTLALNFARQGDFAAHQRRAIEIAQGTLKLTPVGSAEWAMTENNLGNAWQSLPTGDKGENLNKAIAAYEAALTVQTKADHPTNWARTQNNLGAVWFKLPTGNKGDNLLRAIAAFDDALTVFTKDSFPREWAAAENNLGAAWRDLPTGDKANNLTKAIAAYEDALTVRTKEALPAQWANTLGNLAAAWRDLPTGNRVENLQKAIAAYEEVLTIYGDGAVPAVQLSAEASLSWTQLLARDFQGALATASRAAQAGVVDLPLERNHAHALLFLGRIAEAKAIYLKHLGEQSEQSGKTWEQVVLEDFDELEKNGLTSPEIPQLRELLAAKSR